MKRILAATLAALGLTVGLAVPQLAAPPKAEAAVYADCYVGVDGWMYCWRLCSPQEEFDGCYNGWARVYGYWYA